MTIQQAPPVNDRSWATEGACVMADPDEFFVSGAEQHQIKVTCMQCPVRVHCLADALDNRIEFGVWGGLTERERRRLLRQRPEVDDWFSVLCDEDLSTVLNALTRRRGN